MSKNKMLVVLLEEINRAAIDYLEILNDLSVEDFIEIRDSQTSDQDCVSVQSVTRHVVHSGYIYANYIFGLTGDQSMEYKQEIQSPVEAIEEVQEMLDYTESSLKNLWSKDNNELRAMRIDARWKVSYDLEQFLEHAIVHILRHRYQIENFLAAN